MLRTKRRRTSAYLPVSCSLVLSLRYVWGRGVEIQCWGAVFMPRPLAFLRAYKVDYTITFLQFELHPPLFTLLKWGLRYTAFKSTGYLYLPREQFNHFIGISSKYLIRQVVVSPQFILQSVSLRKRCILVITERCILIYVITKPSNLLIQVSATSVSGMQLLSEFKNIISVNAKQN